MLSAAVCRIYVVRGVVLMVLPAKVPTLIVVLSAIVVPLLVGEGVACVGLGLKDVMRCIKI